MLIRAVPGGAGAPLLSGMLTFNQIQKGHIPPPLPCQALGPCRRAGWGFRA